MTVSDTDENGEGAGSTKGVDEARETVHNQSLHQVAKTVNTACSDPADTFGDMAKDDSKIKKAQGARLRAARIAAKYKSAREAAIENHWAESTYTAHERGSRTIGTDDAEKYARRFGTTTAREIIFGGSNALSASPTAVRPTSNASVRSLPIQDLGRRLPIYGKAVGGSDGAFIMNGERIGSVPCPPQLADTTDAYAVVVHGDSMEPRYEDGEAVILDPSRRPVKGNYVVAQIQVDEHSAPHAFVKKFVRWNSEHLVLEQFNPPLELRFDSPSVVSVHYVLTGRDLQL